MTLKFSERNPGVTRERASECLRCSDSPKGALSFLSNKLLIYFIPEHNGTLFAGHEMIPVARLVLNCKENSIPSSPCC